jgi:hypothetical protein
MAASSSAAPAQKRPSAAAKADVEAEAAAKKEAEEAAQIMIDAVHLEVPSRVDVEIGPSWGEAK